MWLVVHCFNNVTPFNGFIVNKHMMLFVCISML